MKKVEEQKLQLLALVEKGRLSQAEFAELVKGLDGDKREDGIFELSSDYVKCILLIVPVFVAIFFA